MRTGKQLSWEWTETGDFNFTMGTFKDTGKSWVKGDVCFIQFKKMYGDLPYGATVYRNPDGTKEAKNQ